MRLEIKSTNKERMKEMSKKLIVELADGACDSIDLKSLVAFYYDKQVEYMETLSEAELIEHAYMYGNFEEGEVEEMLKDDANDN